MFPIRNDLRQGDTLSPLFFNFVFEYGIRRVQENQNGLKLYGTNLLLVYVNDVNILIGSVHNIKENTDTFLVGNKETGLEVSADKTKCMVMSRDQNGRRSHNIKINNSFFKGWKSSNVWETP